MTENQRRQIEEARKESEEKTYYVNATGEKAKSEFDEAGSCNKINNV